MAQTKQMVYELKQIRNNYIISGWFSVDFVSVIPFDILLIINLEAIPKSASSRLRVRHHRCWNRELDAGLDELPQAQRSIAADVRCRLQVLRLVKLLRLARAWGFVKDRTSDLKIDYNLLTLIMLLFALSLFSHWMVCY